MSAYDLGDSTFWAGASAPLLVAFAAWLAYRSLVLAVRLLAAAGFIAGRDKTPTTKTTWHSRAVVHRWGLLRWGWYQPLGRPYGARWIGIGSLYVGRRDPALVLTEKIPMEECTP